MGIMRLGCIAIVIALGLLFGGGQGIYETWTGSQVHVMTYAQFVKEKPSVGRYRITDGEWRLIEASAISSQLTGDASGALYIPVRGPGNTGAEKVELLLHLEDPENAGAMSVISKMSPERLAAEMKRDPVLTKVHKPVEGMVEMGMNSDSKDNDALRKGFGEDLSPNYVVLTEGREPIGYLGSTVMLGAGLLILAVGAALGLRKGAGEVLDD